MECSSCKNPKISPISPPFGGFLCNNGHMNCVTCADVSPGICPICHADEQFVELRFTTENITTDPSPDIDFEYIPNITKAPIQLLNKKNPSQQQMKAVSNKTPSYSGKLPASSTVIKSISDYELRKRYQKIDSRNTKNFKTDKNTAASFSRQREALKSRRDLDRRTISAYRRPVVLTPASSIVTVCHKEDYLNVSRARMAARRVREQRGIQFLKERCEKRGIPYDFKLPVENNEPKPNDTEVKKTEQHNKNVLKEVNNATSTDNLIQKASNLNKVLVESKKKLNVKDYEATSKKLADTRHAGGSSQDSLYQKYVAETIARFPRLIKPIIPGSHPKKNTESLRKAREMVSKMVDTMVTKNKKTETVENPRTEGGTTKFTDIAVVEPILTTKTPTLEKHIKPLTTSSTIKKQNKEIQEKLNTISESIQDSFDKPTEINTELDKYSKKKTEKTITVIKEVDYRPVSTKDDSFNIFHVENKVALDLTKKKSQNELETAQKQNEVELDLSTNKLSSVDKKETSKIETDIKKNVPTNSRNIGGSVESSTSRPSLDSTKDDITSTPTIKKDQDSGEILNVPNSDKKSKESEQTESKGKMVKKNQTTLKPTKTNANKEIIQTDSDKTKKIKILKSKTSKIQEESKGSKANKLQVSKVKSTTEDKKPVKRKRRKSKARRTELEDSNSITTKTKKLKQLKSKANKNIDSRPKSLETRRLELKAKMSSKTKGTGTKVKKEKKEKPVDSSVIKKSQVFEKLMGKSAAKTKNESTDKKTDTSEKGRKSRIKGGHSKDDGDAKKKSKSTSKSSSLKSSLKKSDVDESEADPAPSATIENYETDFEENLEKAKKNAFNSILKSPETNTTQNRKKVKFLNKDTVYHLKAKTKTLRESKAAKIMETTIPKIKVKQVVSKKKSEVAVRRKGGSIASTAPAHAETTEEVQNADNKRSLPYTILKSREGSKFTMEAIRDPATTEPKRSKSKNETTDESKISKRSKSKAKKSKGDSDDKSVTSAKSKTKSNKKQTKGKSGDSQMEEGKKKEKSTKRKVIKVKTKLTKKSDNDESVSSPTKKMSLKKKTETKKVSTKTQKTEESNKADKEKKKEKKKVSTESAKSKQKETKKKTN